MRNLPKRCRKEPKNPRRGGRAAKADAGGCGCGCVEFCVIGGCISRCELSRKTTIGAFIITYTIVGGFLVIIIV